MIGEGRYLAESALMHREQDESTSLNLTLYNVHEAKKYAERVASVGKTTTMVVLWPDRARVITSAGRTFLSERFEKYGPQQVPDDLDFPEAGWGREIKAIV